MIFFVYQTQKQDNRHCYFFMRNSIHFFYLYKNTITSVRVSGRLSVRLDDLSNNCDTFHLKLWYTYTLDEYTDGGLYYNFFRMPTQKSR